MTLQTSGPIKASEIQDEFGGTNPVSLSEYYGVDTGVPASGPIRYSDFYGTSVGGGVVENVAKRTFKSDAAERSTYTFSSMSIGTASDDRWVVVIGGSYQSADHTLTSVTVGGISCQFVEHTTSSSGFWSGAYIAWGKIPTSTSASVVVKYNRGVASCCAQVLTVTGGPGFDVVDTVKAKTTRSVTLSDVSCTDGGIVLIVSNMGIAISQPSVTLSWNGINSAIRTNNATAYGDEYNNYPARKLTAGYVLPTETSSVRDLSIVYTSVTNYSAACIAVSLVPS